MVICLERVADLHMSQLMSLPLTVSCISKIQIGFTFLVPAYPGSPRKRAVKWVCVCVFVWVVSGLTECLLCRIIVTLCVEFCNWCDNFALKISVVTDSQENFLCNSDRNFHLSLTKLLDYFVKFEIRNINFMQQTTSSFLPQTPISCFLANVCNVQGAYLKCSASAADCSAGFSL